MPKIIALPSSKPFKPQLAVDCPVDAMPSGPDWGYFPKIDGVRGLVLPGKGLVGRSLDAPRNPNACAAFSIPLLEGMDGEITVGSDPIAPNLVGVTSGALNAKEGAKDWHYWVFDLLTRETIDLPYIERRKALEWAVLRLEHAGIGWVHIVPCTFVQSQSGAKMYQMRMERAGYEGAIVRRMSASHKNGRSTVVEGGLMRLKSFIDFEIRVTDILEGSTNNNIVQTSSLGYTKRSAAKAGMEPSGKVGSFVGEAMEDVWWLGKVVIKAGQIITASAGEMDAAERKLVWEQRAGYVGRLATVKFMPYGTREAPRFPTFRSWRYDIGGGL